MIEKILRKELNGFVCKGKYVNKNNVELIYDIRFKKVIDNQIIDRLSDIIGVETVNIVSSNTDTMG